MPPPTIYRRSVPAADMESFTNRFASLSYEKEFRVVEFAVLSPKGLK